MKTFVGVAGAGVLFAACFFFRPVDCPGCGRFRARFATEEPLELSCLDCGDRGRLPFFRESSRPRGLSNPWLRDLEYFFAQDVTLPQVKVAPPHTPDDTRAALPAVILAARAGDVDLAAAGAGTLGFMGPSAPEATFVLMEASTSSSYRLRRHAVEALGKIHADARSVVPRLIETLGDPHFLVRWMAALALRDFGSAAAPGVPALIEALKDPDRHVRDRAADALRGLASAIPAAREALPLLPPRNE